MKKPYLFDGGTFHEEGSELSDDEIGSTTFLNNSVARRVPISLRLLYPLVQVTIGALIVGLSLDLSNLAEKCNVSTSAASWSLVVLGLGVLTSMVFVRYVSPYRYAHDSLPMCLLVFSFTTSSLPYVTSIVWLYITTFVIGFVQNVAGTEIYSLIRKLYGPYAGPWCSVIHLSFVLGGVVGNVLSILSYAISGYTGEGDDSTTCINCSPWYFITLASCMFSLAIIFLFVRDPERGGFGCGICRRKSEWIRRGLVRRWFDHATGRGDTSLNGGWRGRADEESEIDDNENTHEGGVNECSLLLPPQQSGVIHASPSHLLGFSHNDETSSLHNVSAESTGLHYGVRGDVTAPHYNVEIAIAIVMMSLTGCEAVLVAYLTTFAEVTGIESYTSAYYQATVAWICVFVGMFLGMLDQAYERVNNENLPNKIMLRLSIAVFALLLVMIFYESEGMLWFATSLFSFMNGPLLGYSFDWLNRATYASELSTGIVMAGSNSGPAMLVVLTLATWYGTGIGVWAVIYVTATVTSFMIPLIWWTRYLSYRPAINPLLNSSSDGGNHPYRQVDPRRRDEEENSSVNSAVMI